MPMNPEVVFKDFPNLAQFYVNKMKKSHANMWKNKIHFVNNKNHEHFHQLFIYFSLPNVLLELAKKWKTLYLLEGVNTNE